MGVIGKHRVKRAYTVLLLSYFVLLILPAGFTVYLQREVFRTSERKCVESTVTELARAGATLEKQLENMDAAVLPLSFDSDMALMMSMPRPRGGETGVYAILRFSQRLDERFKGVAMENTGYRVLIQDNEFVFYNGAVSYGFDFYCKYALSYAGMDASAWREAVFLPRKRALLPMDEITFAGNVTVKACTYNYPLSRRVANGEIRRAAVQFFISKASLEALFPFIGEGGSAYIYTGQGEMLAEIGRARGETPAFARMDGNSGFFYSEDGGDLLAYYRVSPEILLAVALETRVAISDAIAVRKLSFIAIGLYALAEAVLCFYLARRNAMPIARFVSSVRGLMDDAEKSEKTSDYAYLDRTILHMEKSRQQMNEALNEKKSLEARIRLERLTDAILEGGAENMARARARADEMGVNLNARMYCAVTLAVFGQLEALEERAAARPENGVRALVTRYRDGYLSFLFFLDGEGVRENRETALSYLRALCEGMRPAPHGGVGKMYDSLEDAQTSCQQSLYCAQLEGTGNDFDIFEQVSRAFNAPHFPFKQQQRLQNAVRHGDEGAIHETFARIMVENTEERHLSSALKGVLLASVEAALLTAAEEATTEENLSDLLHSVRRGENFPERMRALEDAFVAISRAQAGREGGRNEGLKREFLNYVREGYAGEGIGVADAAARFHLSESYFSTLFKELIGEPFSQYLESVRLQRATELLTGSAMSVEEIAKAVGYLSDTSFRRAYKRALGLTPAQAREAANRPS